MLKIAIVEDNRESSENLKRLILQCGREIHEETDIHCYYDGLSFIEEYTADYDIVMMDIEMPHMNGMEAAKKLREMDREVCLIFLTVMSQYVFAGYDVDASAFLVKPVNEDLFRAEFQRICKKVSRRNSFTYVFSVDDEHVRVNGREIIYVESLNHYCLFHTERGTFRMLTAMKKVENELREFGFLRSDNSYLVNPMYIRNWSRDTVIMENGERIPVSRARKKDFFARLAGIIGE